MLDLFLRNITVAAYRHDLSKVEKLVTQLLEFAPIPIVQIDHNSKFQRVRNNYHGEIFLSESEISFRKDAWNIKEFGRANIPYSSKFYCSLSSKYINEIRLINVLETNKEFRQKQSIRKRQVFTSGQWVSTRPLYVAIFPFNKFAVISNDEIRSHLEKYQTIMNTFSKEQQQNCKRILPFISHFLSAKHINNHWDYLISAFCSELILDKYNLDGILYPSVRADFKSYNLVLQPEAVLNKLYLQKAAMFELLLNRQIAVIDNVADGEISFGNTILWSQLERTSENKMNRMLE